MRDMAAPAMPEKGSKGVAAAESGDADWCAMNADLLGIVVAVGKLPFRDVLAMTGVCTQWRSSLLSQPVDGVLACSYQLRKGWSAMRSQVPGVRSLDVVERCAIPASAPLPRLVSRSAQWGNASSALIVAIAATDVALRRSRRSNPRGRVSTDSLILSYSREQDVLQLWKRAAHLGSKPAQMLLGEAFYRGGGVAFSSLPCIHDIEQAIMWLTRAAEGGDSREGRDAALARTELLLAYIFADGQEGGDNYSDFMLYGRSEKATQEAIYWYRRAAKHGSHEAQEALRSLYSTGQY